MLIKCFKLADLNAMLLMYWDFSKMDTTQRETIENLEQSEILQIMIRVEYSGRLGEKSGLSEKKWNRILRVNENACNVGICLSFCSSGEKKGGRKFKKFFFL